MQLTTYVNFSGQCEAAFKYYEKVFGGKILMLMTFGESAEAMQASPEMRDQVMHAQISIGESLLMGSDSSPAHRQTPAGFYVNIGLNDPADAERIFHALAENGKVQMPIAETFWAARFGMLVDQFGIPWMVNCEKRPS